MNYIECFIRNGNYQGRRFSPILSDSEVKFIVNLIVEIIKKNPDKICCLDEFDLNEHPYVDYAYYSPIYDYLKYRQGYSLVYNVPCPICKNDFFIDKEFDKDIKLIDLQTHCDTCSVNYSLKTEFNSSYGTYTYIETVDFPTCLKKISKIN